MAGAMPTLQRERSEVDVVTLLATAVVVGLAVLALGVFAVRGLTLGQRWMDGLWSTLRCCLVPMW